MKTLYLLRHAHAIDAAPVSCGDHERFLSETGIRQAEQVAACLQARGIVPDLVSSSSSVRTSQTVRIVFGCLPDEALAIPAQFSRMLYLASAATLFQHISDIEDDVERLLVVAHNPGLSDLSAWLGAGTDFSPATLAVFNADIDSWQDFAPGRHVRLEYVFNP
jgi:phosphohistidine phosphatase